MPFQGIFSALSVVEWFDFIETQLELFLPLLELIYQPKAFQSLAMVI